MLRSTLAHLFVVAVIALLPRESEAEQVECRPVFGWFSSAPGLECTSPVGMCTEGRLHGLLRAGYEFTMAQIIAPNDDSIPTVSFFTGLSEMTTRRGMILGTDAGTIDLNPFGSGRFTTLITITDGTGRYQGASGYLQIRGTLDFATGGARGDYVGKICTPADD